MAHDQDSEKWLSNLGAAWQGDPAGEAYIGWAYLTGTGIGRNEVEGRRWLHKAAIKGDANGQFLLAVSLANGLGGYKSEADALMWYKRAAENNHLSAQEKLGSFFKNGKVVVQDDSEAICWFLKAAQRGHAKAQVSLGIMILEGRVEGKTEADAVLWFRKAAKQGDPLGQTNLGTLYLYGKGIEKDESKAIQWYQKASEKGFGPAQYALGWIYLEGLSVKQDNSEAARWFQKAANQGDLNSLLYLAWMHYEGIGVDKSHDKSHEMYVRAAKAGSSSAEASLGWMTFLGHGVTQSIEESRSWFKKAASQGDIEAELMLDLIAVDTEVSKISNLGMSQLSSILEIQTCPEAQYMIGTCLFLGRECNQNKEAAGEWFKKAANQGFAPAQFALGVMHHIGEGLEQDSNASWSWMNESARRGNKKAKNFLDKRLRSDGIDLKSVHEALDHLVGLDDARHEIREAIAVQLANKLRARVGLPLHRLSLNFVFSGPPGTGKTTMARIFGNALKLIGTLTEGHFIETTAADLISGYLGQTALKTREVLEKGLNGVLFIDEAYALAGQSDGKGDQFGKEAVTEIIKYIEDNIGKISIILAGYPDEMDKLLSVNPGLKSRFTNHVPFTEYADEDLLEILRREFEARGWVASDGVMDKCSNLLTDLKLSDKVSFGNAREVRNLAEKICKRQSLRLVGSYEAPSEAEMRRVTCNDLPDSIR